MSIPTLLLGFASEYLPQEGPTIGARVYINSAENIPQPSNVKYIPPEVFGYFSNGKPIYQGLPTLVLNWTVMDIDGFQALSTQFFPKLNTPEGPVVSITWPSPYEAGRYLEAQAYMQWPKWGDWSELWIRDVEVQFSSFSLAGQGLYLEAPRG